MNLLIVDDEELARQRLKTLVEELGDEYQVLGEAETGEQAIEWIDRFPVDVVLLDIHMPGMDGLEVAEVIAQRPVPPAIIFTTAYSEHALSAFSVNASDYLLKPVRRDKLKQALEKLRRLTKPQLQQDHAVGEEWLSSRFRGGVERIPLHQVYYFRADNKYVLARHQQGEALLEDSLKSLEERYAGQVMRVHRKALVFPERIRGLEKDVNGAMFVVFDGIEDRLEVSRRHLPEIRRLLLKGA